MAEWLKAPVSKTGIGESLSGVRISPSPQHKEYTQLMLRERRRKAAFCIAKGEIRKAEAGAPSQGRAKFQQKFTPDRISPLRTR